MSSIYKYYTPKEYNLEALRKGYFFFSKAKHLNDPFELSFSLFAGLKINNNVNFKGDYEPLKDYGICCFTPKYDNKRMWAMYAANYTGFVVEFDESFLKHYKFDWADPQALPIPRLLYEPVEYIDSLEELDAPNYRFSLNYYEEHKDNLEIKVINDEHDAEYLFIHLCRIKEKHSWQEESEKRLIACRDLIEFKMICGKNGVCYDVPTGYKVPFPKKIVKRIICGTHMSDNDIEKLRQIANEYGINRLYKVMPSMPFKLELTLI